MNEELKRAVEKAAEDNIRNRVVYSRSDSIATFIEGAEFMFSMLSKPSEIANLLPKQEVNAEAKTFDVDCAGQLMFRVVIENNYPTFIAAMNGGGYPVDVSEIRLVPYRQMNDAIKNYENQSK